MNDIRAANLILQLVRHLAQNIKSHEELATKLRS